MKHLGKGFVLPLLVLTLATPGLAVAGVPAAASVTVANNTLTFTGNLLDETVTVVNDNGVWKLTDDHGVSAGAGCTQVDPQTVDCPLTALVVLDGKEGADTLDVSTVGVGTRLIGGSGADTLKGGTSADIINAKDGSAGDTVNCGAGNDQVTLDLGDSTTGCESLNYGPRVNAKVVAEWQAGRRTVVKKLKVTKVPTSGKVVVRCSGTMSCPFKSRTGKVVSGTSTLTRFFKGARLKPSTVVEVRVTAPSKIGKVVRFTIRKNKLPKRVVLCLPPGGSKPVSC